MPNTLKINDWYNLICDEDNIIHRDIIENLYVKLLDFLDENNFSIVSDEKEFKANFIHFLYKNSTHSKYKYF